MALIAQIGADASNYNKVMSGLGPTAQKASNEVSQGLASAAKSTDALGGSAMSASMRFAQMRSGISAARDGVLAFSVGGQAAERSLLAMGHHITSLINETGSLKGAFGALVTSLWGAGGLILAISLAAELWSKYSEKQDEAKNSSKDYVDTLNTVRQAQLKGQQDGENELVRVRLLYNATQDHTLSIKQRNQAYDELDKKYPKFFTNADREKTLLGENKVAYDNLAISILAAANAKAYENQIGTNSNRSFEDQQKINDEYAKQIKLQQTVDAENAKQRNNLQGPQGTQFSQSITGANAMAGIVASRKAVDDLYTDQKRIKSQNDQLLKLATSAESAANFKTTQEIEEKTKKTKEQKTELQNLEATLKSLQDAEVKWLQAGNIQNPLGLTDLEVRISRLKAQIEELKQESNIPQAQTGDTVGDSIRAIDPMRPVTTDLGDTDKAQQDLKQQGDLYRLSHIAKQQDISDTKLQKKALQDLTQVLGGGLTNAFQSALAGTQSFGAAFGQFIVQLIERLIAAIAAAAILAALLSFTGLGALTGAATGAGAFGKNLVSGLSSIKLADGGITTGPTHALIGEGHEKEAVMPLSKLNAFVQTNGGMQHGQIVGILQGPDLVLQYQRATIQKGRVG